MSERIIPYIIKDIIWCIDKITSYTNGIDFETFNNDPKTYDAVLRNIEVIGEAVNRLPDFFLLQHTDIPWNLMISTRNRLIHGYDSIDTKIVWNIVNNDLAPLKTAWRIY